MVYVGFMVDADAGPESNDVPWYTDDRAGSSTPSIVSVNPNNPADSTRSTSLSRYMYDDPYGQDGNVGEGLLRLHVPRASDGRDPDAARAAVEYPDGADAGPRSRVRDLVERNRGSRPRHGPVPLPPRTRSGRTRDPRSARTIPSSTASTTTTTARSTTTTSGASTSTATRRRRRTIDFCSPPDRSREIVPGDTLEFQYAFVMGQGSPGHARERRDGAADLQRHQPGGLELRGRAREHAHPLGRRHASASSEAGDHGGRSASSASSGTTIPEDIEDPLTRLRDFYGYQVWKAVGWTVSPPSRGTRTGS